LRVGFYHAPFIKSTGEKERCAFRRRTGRGRCAPDGRRGGSLRSRPEMGDRGPVNLILPLNKPLIVLLLTTYYLLFTPYIFCWSSIPYLGIFTIVTRRDGG